ncbi:MAG: ATP-binding protein [Pseudomonadota bacterium]
MHAAPYGQRTKQFEGVSTRLYNARFDANHSSTRAALAEIRVAMELGGLDDMLVGRVEIALAELFNNIAEHAYRDDGTGEVRCSMGIRGSSLVVEVTDQGGPMPGGEIPEGTLPDLDVAFEDLPEGGFGWHLIHAQTDAISHMRLALGNCTRLNFDVQHGE